MSVDIRTRSRNDRGTVEFCEFHEHALPARIAEHGQLAAAAVSAYRLRPLTLQVGEHAYTYRAHEGRLEVQPGDRGDGALAFMEPAVFSDFAQEIRSAVSLMIGSDAEMRRGKITDLVNWEPTLRALFDGRPAYLPGAVRLADADGPLDLARRFTLDDDPAAMAAFLEAAGFLHIAGVYSPAEMAELSAEMDTWFPRMEQDDERSWWARLESGEQRCVRVTNIGQADVRFPLNGDPRIHRIAALPGDGHTGELLDLLVKPVGVVEGISDPPWHKDCSLGLHGYRCCSLTIGVSVTAADVTHGRLGVVAGSHRASIPLMGLPKSLDLPQVWLDTAPGDVTVHLSCTLHMAAPPKTTERRVAYMGYPLPGLPTREAGIKRIRDRAGRQTFAPKHPS